MKALVFSKRNLKEIVRDPLSLIFGVGLPIIMLCLFCVISSSVDNMPSMFGASEMAPSMATFGLSFLTLFLSLLMANDNNNSFLTRLLASPMKTSDFILGYALPMLPLALAQSILCLTVGAAFGMKINIYTLPTLLALMAASLFFISIGLLFGSIFSPTQVGGISSIVINAFALLSGTWIPIKTIKGGFAVFCSILPFEHILDLVKDTSAGSFENLLKNLLWTLVSSAIIFVAAAFVVTKKHRR